MSERATPSQREEGREAARYNRFKAAVGAHGCAPSPAHRPPLGITLVADEPLARHTTFRIGGPADLYAAVSRIEQLEALAELALAHEVPITILGGGSNVLVSDAGVRGLVIANQTRNWVSNIGYSALDKSQVSGPNTQHPISNICLTADSGVPLAGLARAAIREGLAGLEWAVSVPGTVGGAVVGNAGAHGGQIADILAWALVTYPGQGRRLLSAAELKFGYRSSILKAPPYPPPRGGPVGRPATAGGAGEAIVLAAGFELKAGDVAELTARADGFLARRRASQPTEPSAGSVFRNPPGDYAGRLIEAVGLKGYSIGGAQISPRHANFIVNTGSATAADVFSLMELIKARVYERFGIELVPEISLIGEW